MKEKKINKNFYCVIAAALVAVLAVLCGGLLMQSPTTSANAAGPTVTQDGYTLSCNYSGTAQYIIFPRSYGENDYNNGGWSNMQNSGVKNGTWTNPMDLRPLYNDGTLKRGTTYTIWIDGIGGHTYWGGVSVGTFMVEPLTLPETPTREGHTFAGWYLDAALTQPYNGEPITEDMTFHAKFLINRYSVTFDSAGGAACDTVTVDWNTAVTDLPTPTRTGYDFLGWYDAAGNQYTDGAIKADTNLTARWAIKVFTVTFMVNDTVYKTVSVEYGQSFDVAAAVAGMAYYNLFDETGNKLGRAGVVTGDMTLVAAEMSQTEKVGTWLARNWWTLIAAGVLIVGLGIAVIVMAKR